MRRLELEMMVTKQDWALKTTVERARKLELALVDLTKAFERHCGVSIEFILTEQKLERLKKEQEKNG